MTRLRIHPEQHHTGRVGWLRAAVLGANDGIVSTASLIVGVASASAQTSDVLVAGIAALVAGAMSMAAGEYVSVSSQADAEKADLAIERRELRDNTDFEHRELAEIYVRRGLDRELAHRVADQLMKKDALAAHARDELGISDATRARPVQAAFASAGAFTAGAALPLLTVLASPPAMLVPIVSALSSRAARLRFERWRSSAIRHVMRTSQARNRSRSRSWLNERYALANASCATSSASSRLRNTL